MTATTQSQVVAALIGDAGEDAAETLTAYGADRVLTLDNAALGPACGRAVANALAVAIAEARPYAVLFAATADGRDLASRIAAQLSLGLTGDAIDLEIDEDGRLVQLKPALGGNVIAPILSKTLPNLVTLRPGLLSPIEPETGAVPTIEALPAPQFNGADVSVVETHYEDDPGGIALAQAEIVLGAGMGIGGPENLPQIQELAAQIGATVATTRNVVHAGWLPHQVQVGISGRTIAPPRLSGGGHPGRIRPHGWHSKGGGYHRPEQQPPPSHFQGGGFRRGGRMAGVSAGAGGGGEAGSGGRGIEGLLAFTLVIPVLNRSPCF